MISFLREKIVRCLYCNGVIHATLFAGGDATPCLFLNMEPHTCEDHDDATADGFSIHSGTMHGLRCHLSRINRCFEEEVV